MIPTLRTERLRLDPVGPDDAQTVTHLAGDPAVAYHALAIPHPFAPGLAEAWIESLDETAPVFAIRTAAQRPLIGLVGLTIDAVSEAAELSYWLGRPAWGHGFATEAARAVVEYGFEALGLNRLWATTLARNAASAGVLRKLGMREEGRLRQHVRHWGALEDLVWWGLLRAEWERANPPGDR